MQYNNLSKETLCQLLDCNKSTLHTYLGRYEFCHIYYNRAKKHYENIKADDIKKLKELIGRNPCRSFKESPDIVLKNNKQELEKLKNKILSIRSYCLKVEEKLKDINVITSDIWENLK